MPDDASLFPTLTHPSYNLLVVSNDQAMQNFVDHPPDVIVAHRSVYDTAVQSDSDRLSDYLMLLRSFLKKTFTSR